MATAGSGNIAVKRNVPTVDAGICSGCGRCVAACIDDMITLETVRFHKSAVITQPERCTSCGRCLSACPLTALR